MMLDSAIVVVSLSTTYGVLKAAGLIPTWNVRPSKKDTCFVQLLVPHQQQHVDDSPINMAETFYSMPLASMSWATSLYTLSFSAKKRPSLLPATKNSPRLQRKH
jgi:hypothetical protein